MVGPSIHRAHTRCRALVLPQQSPWLLDTILDGSPLWHRIPASWHSFCWPRKDDRQSQPHLGINSIAEWDLNSGSLDPKPTTLTIKPTPGTEAYPWRYSHQILFSILVLPPSVLIGSVFEFKHWWYLKQIRKITWNILYVSLDMKQIRNSAAWKSICLSPLKHLFLNSFNIQVLLCSTVLVRINQSLYLYVLHHSPYILLNYCKDCTIKPIN